MVGSANYDPEITFLIGGDFFWSLGSGNLRTLRGNLRAVEARLGWTVQGLLLNPTKNENCRSAIVLRTTVNSCELSNMLKKLCELESIGIQDETMESPNEDVRQKLERNIKMNNGHYEVGLPRQKQVDLANKEGATKRLQQLTRILLSDSELMDVYDHSIFQYLPDGHAGKVIETAENSGSDLVDYLPQRAMIR